MTAVLAVITAIFAAPVGATKLQLPPLYDEKAIQSEFSTWIDKIDYGTIASEYPKAVKDLLSVDVGRQMAALKLLGESASEKSVPWIYPFVNHENQQLRIWAQSSMSKLLSGIIHLDQSKRRERRTALRPAAWIALEMLRRTDDGNGVAYGCEIAGMLRIAEFERELKWAEKSPHPAVSGSAARALEAIRKNED